MANIYSASRDYTKPAIDQRVAELLKRRIGAREDLPTESTKERLAKFKEIRNARQGLLKITHRHVLETVAYILNIGTEVLEEGILDKDEYVNVFNSFFTEGGRQAIVVYLQPMSPPTFDSGRWTPQLSKEQQVIRCCITDGTTEEFSGRCVIVYRLKSNMEFGIKQLLDETYYAYAEVDPTSRCVLAGISDLISRLHVRTLTANTQWGELSKSEIGEKMKDNFIGNFKDFCEFLSMTKIDLENVVCFQVNWDLYQKCLAQPENIRKNIRKLDVIAAAEADVRMWMKLMERAIVESQQLRRETETVGPTAELTYWRRLLGQFSSIMNHIKSSYAQAFIQLLTEAKSKLVKKWKILEDHVTTVHILSQDNVKYLYALEKFTQPLYRLDPTKIGDYLPALMYAIRMMYATSRFFNTRKMVTAVYVKITNQMILACKVYLTEDGKISVWNESKCTMISKIKNCIKLCEIYHNCYDDMCKKVEESSDENPFEVSEMYVFGKFATFKTRIIKIMDILETTRMYSILHSSTIEGISTYAQKYMDHFEKISSQNYDPLDHRKPYFDTDYDEFKKSVAEIDVELRTFFHNCVSLMPNVTQSLNLIARFQKLNLKQLRIDRKCMELISMFEQEIEDIRDIYNENRSDPPIPRNIPPIAGRILWVRQLYKRIEVPMNMFKSYHRVITFDSMQKCIKIYNILVNVFIHYELIYYKAWYDSTNIVCLALSSPLFVRHPKTNKYCLNFDSYIYEVIRESEYMSKFGLEVPDFIQILIFCKEKIFLSYERVKKLLKKNDALRKSIPILFLNLMKPALVNLEIAFQPCVSVVTWSSLKISNACAKLEEEIKNAQIIVKEVVDMKEARVDEVLESIAEMILLKLDDYPKSPEQLLADNTDFRDKIAIDLEIKSSVAEKAVIMIINKFIDLISDPTVQNIKYNWMDPERIHRQIGSESRLIQGPFEPGFGYIERTSKVKISQVHNDCIELFAYYNNKLTEALVKCTKNSLDLLKKKATVMSVLVEDIAIDQEIPIMMTYFVLQIPNIIISPSIEELQSHFSKVITNIIETHKKVFMWGQRYSTNAKAKPLDKENLPNTYFQSVFDHKDIIRSSMSLQGLILILRDDVSKVGNSYLRYSYIWAENRNEIIQSFIDSKPLLQEIKEKFLEYEDLMTEIKNLPDRHILGPLQINTDKLKLAFLVEANAWKKSLGILLSNKYKEKLRKITDYIFDKNKVLARHIKDLEDVRVAMKCLGEIRDNFVSIDMELILIEETYTLMGKFNVDILKEDQDIVDGLRYNFSNLLNTAKQVQAVICEMQEPLKKELVEGVAVLKKKVAQFDIDFELNGPMVEGIPAKEASERLILFQARFEELWERYETYSSGESLFGIEVTEYPALQQRKRETNLLQKLYTLYLQVMHTIDSYYDIPWSEIDIESIITELADFQNKCRKLPKAMREWPAYIDLKKKIDDFNEMCPLLEMMANKAMKNRHWEKLSKLCKYFFDVESETFTLANVMQAPLLKYKDDVEDICISAVKEQDIEFKLKQIIADWAVINLQFALFKQRGELLLKGIETAEIIAQLEDSLMIISSLLANRYNAPFKKEIQLWQTKLSNTSEILAKWLTVQNLWAYLEAVFIGGDISKQLPTEAKRFNTIDKAWIKLMLRAHEKLNAVETCTGDETMSQFLPHILEQLEWCQKSLSGYLETKRVIFPRFCFISDPTLLEILGQAADCHTIQNYLDGFFDNVSKLKFSEKEYDKIVAMYSREDEQIVLEKEVACTGGVENWLNVLLTIHQQSVGAVISLGLQSLRTSEFDILLLIENSILQVGLLALQVLWTHDSEIAITTAKRDRTIMKKTNRWFLDLLNSLIEITVKDLTKYARIKYECLITIHVHQRDIFDELCRLRIRSIHDFEWLKQCRFYYNDDSEEVPVKITDIEFVYQNEFLGCTDRLAITPLTDRCYITLAQAVGMNFGGAPTGPAGTGKTETTKDMGKALGKYVVVFNCSDQMDFRGLGRIFKGLAQSGTWGCFDEFNRIDLSVLSVAAQQIAIIFNTRKERKTTFLFSDGETYKLNYEFGIFITMNPGYAGRQELPENLKIQFRSVAMMVPDRQIIMRVKLAACGFKENVLLARKFFILYKLCEEQLSKQVHYDFGLRNILSCLRTLSAQKRANPIDSEETTLMRVLCNMNLSKLVDEDEPLFMSLIEDMFPGIKLTTQTYKELQKAIENATDALNIINHKEWNLKTVQLYETSLVRHGLMVLGPTGSGKTRCMWALMRALTEMGMPHKEIRMNPKAITASQMFGRLDVATNDWTDGIFSIIWRRSTQTKKTENLWMVLDGPVDAVWIENLNSVLDDNKTLTLANGDRIIMAPNTKLVFEPDNVDNASPATISRMGMVFVSASVLKWNSILEGWLRKCSSNEARVLRTLFDQIYGDAHTFVQTKLQAKMMILEALYIRQCIDLLEGLNVGNSDPTKTLLAEYHIEKLFLFSLMWSLGAMLELDGRLALQEYLINHESHCNWPKCIEDETIFEYLVSDDGKWMHWSKMVPKFEYPSDRVLEYHTILVPNVDNTRTLYLIDIIARQEKAVLLIGEAGTAKSMMMKSYMFKHDPEYHLNKFFNFSSASTPNMVQRVFESYVEKRVGTTYGPPGGRKMTIFIDDINMPTINEWGDQITNELIRQLMEYKGFYSLDKPGDFCTMQDIMLLAAMHHSGGGRNDIPERLKRQFNIFNCTLPSNKSMDTIFSVIGQGYFCLTRFSETIVNFLPKLISLTRLLWQNTKAKMLPTPAKFHYVFNLRDLSRIWEGMLRIQRAECESITTLLKLWKHECTRVIADRFITAADKEWFQNTLWRIAEKILGPDFQYYSQVETYFVDFLREPPEPTGDEPEDFILEAPKVYEEIPSYDVVIAKVQQNMEQFNEYIRGMHLDLVFFHDALVHLIRISRILGVPRGNALLVGIGGSGKQSLTRLASFIAGYNFFQITLSRIYNVASLMDDLRKLYRSAGIDSKGLTFIFTDNEVKDEAFLEYINNILSVGEVANLFPKDELDEILTTVTPFMKKTDPRRPLTQDNLYDYFISKARNNLHIVLCFSPISGKFRSRALKFPGLISSCTINWFSSWPKDALYAVGEHFLGTYKVICSPEVKQQLMHVVGDIQDDVSDTCTAYFDRFRRQIYVTPRSFLTFLDSYKTLYKQRLDNINTLTSRMSSGLNKLIDAAAQVDVLRHELEKTQEEIAAKNIQVEAILVTVNEKKREAEDVKAKVQVSKDEAEKILKVIAKDKAVAEQKLEAAEPALLEAEAALQTIKAVDIATVRKLAKPPYLITLIMDCVLILFGRKLESVKLDYEHQFLQPSWSESLKVLADTRFLYNLQNFPKDNINAETVDLMMPYLNFHMYTYEAAKQACGNVAGLIQWTISMIAFYEINKDVLPLKANLFVQENKYEIANKNLLEAEELLKEKDDALKIVQNEFDAVMRERQKIIDQAAACQAKMDIAFAMIEGLSGEKIRWTDQVTTFKSETERLVGDVLVLTGFLCYCGPFNQEFRVLLQKKWFDFIQDRKIPISVTLNIVNVLTDTAMIGDWNLQGLPTDELSVQNGIIVTKALRYPLLIDPQLQGKTWIKNKEKGFDLQVTWFSHKYFKNHLEDSVSIGRPLLIQDVGEEIDPVLDNLLEKNFIKIGTSFKVKLGDKEVDISKDFRLYITTKLPNPFYTPEIFAHTSIIDFTVTMKGLEDQLLGRVILSEREELETEKKQLIADVTANNRKIKELETNLLHKLGTVQGSLIEDVELMSVLNTTKQTAAEINRKLNIAKETELKIDVAREEFRPVATRGSVLYFLICDMPHVNSMYQTSLVQFLERFDISMARSEKSPVNQKRIYHIIEYLTYDIFKHKARGLYEIHKYMFILLMTLKIDLQRGSITYEEFQYLIKGGAALDLKAVEPKPCKWITDVTWLNLVALSSLRQFQYIVSQVSASEKVWKHWFDKDAPEEEVIPDGYHALDSFRRLLLIRAWCMDRALSQSRKYIASSLGAKYAEPVITRLDVMHNESRPNTPMICFLSLGSDPTPSIEQLAKRMEIVCRSISMGQGQEVHARRLLSSAKTEGFWTLCQNCHLSLEYMAELANFLLEMEAPHPDFRVWITTEPHKDFPVSLLQMSIKYTYEPPQGIRAGLLATYSSMNQEMLDQCDAAQYIPLIYSVSFLHTVVQERRKFGSLGWNVPYEFNLADWLASCMFINNHLNDYNPKRGINWQSVRYMIGEVQYGGRVTDDYDKRLLNTFAKVWFTEALFAEERFVFYKNYPLLIYKQVNHYMKAIDGMSPIDPPQVYGLHPNADITYQNNTTQTVLDLILSVQPKEAGVAGAESREAVVARQAKEMLEKVPTLYDMFEVKERLHAMDHTAPMNIFLKQEINRIQMVIKLIRVMLKDLLLAIEGIIIMSEELRDIFDNIYDAKIPKTWKARSWESASLGFWFTELLERNQQFSTWLYSGRPIKFWMTGFFNPQGFLTAMKQEITRAHKWALDNVTVHNEVLRNIAEEIKKPPSEGVYVYGLFLEGAGWDRRNSRLCESANKVLYVLMPVVHIFVLHNADKVPLPQDKNLKLYQCPVYKKPQRGYMFLITSLLLPTLKSPDHWILRGVALLCDNK